MPKVASGFDDGDDGGDTGQCPECGDEVYLMAGRCPKCGHWFTEDDAAAMRSGRNVRTEMRIIKIAAAVLLAVVIVAVIIVAVLER